MKLFGYEITIKRKPSSQENTHNKDDTYSRVENLLLQGGYGCVQKLDFLTRETSFDEMCMDSLDKVEFLMHIESAFGIDILDEKFATCQTIGGVVDLVDWVLGDKHQ
ncbi:hypothetical protein 2018Mat167_0480 [Vibrio phage ICP1]|nr:hypothetical protein TUST1-191_00485 [Vibrio phage ICP1_2006_D]ADX88370.1 hypothetical protein TUST1-182_00485 [Vibrio phage ICP1_2006_C]ADX88597.1 hypothetical protein TUST1-159_00485 [Vibrio phage ICP1_2006_B]ADX88823.1 hypothetical protein TUST1-17_00485 [Vibrio phage ICP1_2006_A]ADX89054.1 hypothetical protein TUST1-15_00510 [Vibrio phage ICP1_2005_A]ADX89280.1 hypothetical protein TUST1-2_00490 [Vibrio phage ICP1_2001_A]APD17813.1 hypothetical protein [Vibrio phage JSF4]ASV41850.1 hy